MIKETEFKLIFINDYFNVQFKIRTKKKVKEDLNSFLPSNWLSTSLLIYVLLLFEWDKFTTILHSKYMKFDINDVGKRKKMLKKRCRSLSRLNIRKSYSSITWLIKLSVHDKRLNRTFRTNQRHFSTFHAYFISLINKKMHFFQNRVKHMMIQNDCAVIRFVKVTMIKIYSKMKE